MMIEKPKSLTAVVHVNFNYGESESKKISESEIEILNRILDQAHDLTPDMQEVLVKFAEYMNKLQEQGRAEPG